MHWSRKDIVNVVEKSSYWHERLGPRFVARQTTEFEKAAGHDRMKRWAWEVARGEETYFQKRLSWDGLDEETARAIASGVKLLNPEQLPSWTSFLFEALEISAQFAGQTPEEVESSISFLLQSEPISFEHLLAAFVLCGSRRLALSFDSNVLLSSDARIDLQRLLLKMLLAVAGTVLVAEFSVWRAVPQGEMLSPAQSGTDPGRALYASFLQKMYQGGWYELLDEYPVLARMLAESTELWVGFISEFIQHLGSDLKDLETHFAGGRALGPIQRIATELSDRHNGGKTVLKLLFENGICIIYKPKNIESERSYGDLLGWMNENGIALPFQTFKVVCRETYGWVEAVKHVPPKDGSELRRYFQRAGMLLGLLYVLEGTDCNFQNIVAHGEHPVFIDTETFLQPLAEMEVSDPWGAADLANISFFRDSVFRVGLLPYWISCPAGEKQDFTGLGGPVGRGEYQKNIWECVNTDAMRWSKQKKAIHSENQEHDADTSAASYATEIEEGFRQTYELLMNRGKVITEDRAWAGLRSLELRFLIRNTRTYKVLLENCFQPKNLRDGMDTSIQVDVLTRRFLHWNEKHDTWPIVEAEMRALLQMDIPRFGYVAGSRQLLLGDNKGIENFFVESGFDSMQGRLGRLNKKELDLQASYIHCAFECPPQARVSFETSPDAGEKQCSMTSVEFLSEAVRIAEKIRKTVISAPDGTVSWITRAYNPDAQFWQLQPVGLHLYDGVCGIGLFLAAVERATGGAGFRQLARATFSIVADTDSVRVRQWLLRDGIGAGIGTASVIYALARASEMLGDESLLDAAFRTATLLTSERIASDHRFDLLGGAAGCLLVLLRMYRLRPEPWLLDRAIECGDRLLEARTVSPAGLRAWKTIRDQFLGGFVHGVAGISYALSLLYEHTGKERYREAAAEACGYEDTLFSKEENNWCNLLLPKQNGGFYFWNSWCHGAPGIGLGRLASLGGLDTAEARQDIQRALETAGNPSLNTLDYPCCGNLGRVELLLQAEKSLAQSHCGDRARALASEIVNDANKRGHYRLGLRNHDLVPSFHTGMAGVGYQLLRLAKGDEIPSVLLWE